MRRRRKTKYTWLPQLGVSLGTTPEDDTTLINVTIPVVPVNGKLSDVNIFPVIPDAPNEIPASLQDHLDDFIASEYILKRIVGKFSVTAPTLTDLDVTAGCVSDFCVGLGFFVARAESANAPNAVPIGSGTAPDRKNNYGPLNLTNTREPWIWRRTWVLSCPFVNNASSVPLGLGTSFPHNNAQGSLQEGQHIDAKSVRRVRNDERLWVAVQGVANNILSGNGPSDLTVDDGVLDVRLLGALRRSKNRSNF